MTVSRETDLWRITLQGEASMSDVPRIRSARAQTETDTVPVLVVDDGILSVDTVAYGALVQWAQATRNRNVGWATTLGLETAGRMFQMAGLPVAETMFPSEEAARQALAVPDGTDAFEKKLYATYLSFLPTDEFSYPLQMHCDDRGSFTEIIRTPERGQFSVNISRPGITKGQHWHNTKNEKFAVVSGTGVIRFRKVGEDEVLEYFVSGDKIEVVDIPPGYTHNIENLGDADMITFMWANESFDPDRPDTFRLDV